MGRVGLHLGILSKYQIDSAKRTQLALLQEPRWRQYFNLKRALLESSLPIGLGSDRSSLKVAVTHLSAFSNGDGTLTKQIEQIKEWMESQPPDQPWILAGDFNLLPPGDNPDRLKGDASLYADETNPIEQLFKLFTEVTGNPLSPEARTYLPFGATEPDRKIDYIFYGGPIEVFSAKVLTEANEISDHLPMEIKFQLTTTSR
jgi:endonuclease/exonuclease/phosphatase family metal-dependent hydrolase